MVDRNTKIKGSQILDATITADELAISVAGVGLAGGGGSALSVNVDDSSIEINVDTLQVKASGITNDMLAGSIADGKLVENYIITTEVDDSTIEFNGGSLNIKALGVANPQIAEDTISEAKLDIDNAPVDTYYLQYDDVNGMQWADVSAGYVELSDIISNEIPSGLINSANTDYTIANTPSSGTVEVVLNGLQQEPGSGKDYTISGSTITFVIAPDTGDILIVNYVKA